jgi:fructose-1,6-bisphosphatase
MAMRQVVTIERARDLAAQIATAYGKYGSQTSVPFSVTQLVEIIAVLNSFGNFDGPTKEEINKVTRQLTACQAREAGLRKKLKDGAENA